MVERTFNSIVVVEVVSDGDTVWVNTTAGTIARFGRRGIDVHTADTSGCLLCVPGSTDATSWKVFCQAVWKYHDIEIPENHRPRWL